MAQVEFPSGPDDTSVTAVEYTIHASGGTQDPGSLSFRLVVGGSDATLENGIEARISTDDVLDRFEDFATSLAAELDAQPSSTVTLDRQYVGFASTGPEAVAF